MKRKVLNFAIVIFIYLLGSSYNCKAQENINELQSLKSQLNSQKFEIEQLKQQQTNDTTFLKSNFNSYASSALVTFLFGAFCALWAQNTNRNPWLWFFAGAVFSIITICLLLYDNANDIKKRK